MIFIYFLIDPRDSSIRYIGQTRRGMSRPTGHMDIARKNLKRSKVYSWLRKLDKLNLEPVVRIVEFCDSIEQLDEAEIYWIAHCRFLGCQLTNITEGGRNGSWIAGEDERRRRSESRLGELHPMFGKTHKSSTIKKMQKSHAGKVWTAEQIERRARLRRKPFTCIETGEVFESIKDFVKRGHGSSEIKNVLNGHRTTFKGLHYERIR